MFKFNLRRVNFMIRASLSRSMNFIDVANLICTSFNLFLAGVVGMSSISSSHSTDAGGNVHSGAPPPWLDANDGNVSNIQLNQSDMACVQAKVPGKNRKLNPNRVGAAWAERRKIEIEMEKKSGHATNSNIDADWLPNFGRVWQSGTRKESRKEFEKEKRKLVKTESVSTESEPVKIQPYISKRAVSFAFIINIELQMTGLMSVTIFF